MPAPKMSSNLETTSAVLGEYMLKGWTLTDLHCDTCKVTPLMREPKNSADSERRSPIQFCALCDGGPGGASSSSTQPTTTQARSFSAAETPNSVGYASEEVSFGTRDSDDAAASISQLLLQGYSLLGDNCPNSDCKSLPLVGYPRKKDGSKDGRKLCVGCGGRWVNERDLSGMKLIRGESSTAGEQRGGQAIAESPRSKKRRELYEFGEQMAQSRQKLESEQESTKPVQPVQAATSLEMDMDVSAEELTAALLQPKSQREDALKQALGATSSSLSLTLTRLATSLGQHTAGPGESDDSRYFVDVKLHTEAMRDVLNILERVEKLL